MERPREFGRQTCKLERERNARWAALSGRARHELHFRPMPGHYFCPAAFSRAASSILTSKVRRAKRWNNGKSGAGHNAGCLVWTPRLYDYLDPEEGRIYNDVVRRIQKRFEELESEKSKRHDRRSVRPLTNLMQE